jgi:C-terminal processing protease CtpA/Prc
VSSKLRISASILLIIAAVALVWFGAVSRASDSSGVHRMLVAFNSNGFGRDATDDGSSPPAQSQSQDLAILDYSLEKLQEVYYKPVDVNVLVKGEQSGIAALLKSRHITQTLPPVTTTSADEDAANGLLRTAFTTFGSKVGDDDLTFAAVSGMLDSLGDPYTVFLDPREKRSLTELISGGNFGGIGIYIGQDDKSKSTIIIEPIVGTPADRAGLK